MINSYFNVYTTDIPYEYFDVDSVFTNKSDTMVNSLYLTTGTDSDGMSADHINSDGIYIPVDPDYKSEQ